MARRSVTWIPLLVVCAALGAWRAAAGQSGQQAESVPVSGLNPADAAALSQPPPHAAPPEYPPSGDWGGYRTTLHDKGIDVAGSILLDASRNMTGGLTQDKTASRYLLDLNATLDTEKLFGWHGGTLFIDFENHDGDDGSTELTGDVQGFDNIDGRHFTQIYQFWYQQLLVGDTVRIKGGKIDANTDFSVIEHGKEFLNSSPAYSPTVFPMVTYPDPAPGAEVFWSPANTWYAGLGAYYSNQHDTFLTLSGHPEAIERASGGAFLIGELGDRWTIAGNLPGHAAIGGWGHTGQFPKFQGGHVEGTGGFYAFGDQSFYHEALADGSARDLGLFLQYGASDPSVSQMSQHVGGGVAAAGLVPGRPSDIAGLGISWVKLGDLVGTRYGDETDVELFYRLQLTHWFNFKPDLQYIRHPGGLPVQDALVFTLRAEVDF